MSQCSTATANTDLLYALLKLRYSVHVRELAKHGPH
jgi:hypothetical protein